MGITLIEIALFVAVFMSLAVLAAKSLQMLVPWRQSDFSVAIDVSDSMSQTFASADLRERVIEKSRRIAGTVTLTSNGNDGSLHQTELSRTAAYVLLKHSEPRGAAE